MDRKPRPLPLPAVRRAAWPAGLLVALCFTTLPLFLVLSPGRPSLFDVWQQIGIRVAVRYDDEPKPSSSSEHSDSSRPPPDILLGGLLSPDVSESSCQSRYLSSQYRKQASPPRSPSPYLVSRLREYEALHRRCGPGTPLYGKSVRQLASTRHSMGLADCSYLVWTPGSHLGDRMLSMASAFLYALLTRRVFLVDMAGADGDMAGLFCEPFPGASSWQLAPGFPVRNVTQLRRGSEHSYGSLLGAKKMGTGEEEDPAGVRSESLPSYAYLHLAHDYQLPDQLFFCDDDQTVLAKVNWLLLRSDLYFAPGLFLVPQFEDELRWMFPDTDTVFHHIGRYLFHPSDTVWKTIQGYYDSYMAKFDRKIGLQITTFAWNPVSTEVYFDQIAACTAQEKILPEVDPRVAVLASSEHEAAAAAASSSSAVASKAVLVTSAQPEFAERLKSMYHEHATVTGEPVTVLQPPGAGNQQPQHHKVLVEMFLQSYCDVSVVSGWSTVGYVGHALAGLNPWLLLPPANQTVAHPPCVRAMSMDPCFHSPPRYDCRAKKNGDLGAVLRYIRHCEDVDDGLKLFDRF